MNEVCIIGNIVRDAEFKIIKTYKGSEGTLNEVPLCKLTLAYNVRKDDSEEPVTSFFDLEAWRDLANICRTLHKGQKVKIYGALKQDRFVRADGSNGSKVKIVLRDIDVMGDKTNIKKAGPLLHVRDNEEIMAFDDGRLPF
jgi:single-stranded DNA-binding protein